MGIKRFTVLDSMAMPNDWNHWRCSIFVTVYVYYILLSSCYNSLFCFLPVTEEGATDLNVARKFIWLCHLNTDDFPDRAICSWKYWDPEFDSGAILQLLFHDIMFTLLLAAVDYILFYLNTVCEEKRKDKKEANIREKCIFIWWDKTSAPDTIYNIFNILIISNDM